MAKVGPLSYSKFGARPRSLVVGIVLITSLVIASLPLATAEASIGDEEKFDARVVELINEFRVANGLNLLVEWGPLSDQASEWSSFMEAGSNNCTGAAGTNFRHSALSLTNAANPPDTTAIGENINYNCGVAGVEFTKDWANAAGPLPRYCTTPIDYTIAEKTVCDWLAAPTHRGTILTAELTHFGAGTGSRYTPTGSLERYSTTLFTRSYIPTNDVSCDGKLSITDALFIAQLTVGTRQEMESCALDDPARQINVARADVDGDGRASIGDALFIAQCLVGLKTCPE